MFEAEDNFGKPNSTHHWIAPPPGSFINTTHNRSTTRVQSAGSKIWDTVAYGQLTGSWEWTFLLDYNYLEPLYFAFEGFSDNNAHTTHTYEKHNAKRVKSFTLRRKMLNRMAGGPDTAQEQSDEVEEVYGCVVRSISFSKASGTSQIQVRMTGFFVDEKMYLGDLEATDYKSYTGKLAEYFCMFVGGTELSNSHYVANTDSLEITIENNADPIYNTCSPFASQYYEGITNYSFSTSCYSNNPYNYKLRVYGGGTRVTPASEVGSPSRIARPLSKGLAPLNKIFLIAYDGSARSYDSGTPPEHTEDYDITEADIRNAYDRSTNKICIDITDCVIKSLTWPKGDGSRIMDNISSAECKTIKMDVTTTAYNPNPTVTTGDIIKNRVTFGPNDENYPVWGN